MDEAGATDDVVDDTGTYTLTQSNSLGTADGPSGIVYSAGGGGGGSTGSRPNKSGGKLCNG